MYMYKNQSNVHFRIWVIIIYTHCLYRPHGPVWCRVIIIFYNVVVLGLPESNMPFSTFGQRVQSHTPSNYRLYHSLISKLENFDVFHVSPIVCFVTSVDTVLWWHAVPCGQMTSLFLGVFKDMFFPKYVLKVLR